MIDPDQRPALDSVTLHIENGETVSIVGPSGCGKSTLLKVVAGLEMPEAGQVRFNNFDVTKISPQDRGVGMVFQDYALYPSKEGEDNLGYYFEVHRRTKEEKEQRLRETAELMGIGFDLLMSRQVDTLSGGEKQRVGIARCIVRDPNVFLMDEPISNLDAKLRERTRTEMRRLLKKFGITTLYVTHDQQEAIFMGDRIAVMRTGRVEQFGTFDDLYYSPANLFVATLIGTPPMSVIPITFANGQFTPAGDSAAPGWSAPFDLGEKLPNGKGRLGVRPEGWLVSQHPGQGIPMKVTRIERLYTERAAFANGYLGGALVNALVPLDFPETNQVSLEPDWTQVSLFDAVEETALHVPGAPELF
ncbi:MAG: ABC transporter ATP-binding protein [Anaerolineales bacterium]|nr:ABC transporter ATP-binding protein [Anaerolineales bacterium]